MRIQILPVEDVPMAHLRKWNSLILAGTPYVVQGAIHVLRGLLDAKPLAANGGFGWFLIAIPIHGSLLFFSGLSELS